MASGQLFSTAEINRLGKRFQKLDIDRSGTLTKEEFLQIPGLETNPLVDRVIDVFDDDRNGEVDFSEFVEAISMFTTKGNRRNKFSFLFKIYDMDNDGYISNGELFQILRVVSGQSLRDTELQHIVDKTIVYADRDGDGKLSFMEFLEVVKYIRIDRVMTVKV